ncbi:MAG TPA: TlpA disulfide reductase family protein [Bacteroidia bacterium]|nr:TlpA disulfide reductase family protein [Bacteroidia bacterium]
MKKTTHAVVVATLFSFFIICNYESVSAQTQERKIPSASVKTLDGKTVDTKNLSNNGKPILISVWETTCKPCIMELDAIAENYSDWQKETGVKVVAISIDNTRTASQVPVIVNSKDWQYEIYSDINQDFKRAMSFSYCPFNFLVDNNGNIVWQSNSYAPGDENVIYELLKKLSKNEKLN